MPELPEVETIARQLNGVLPGKTIKAIEVLREKSFQGKANKVIGKSINLIRRKAKTIIIELDSEQWTVNSERLILLIHLKMTGQLIFTPDVKTASTSGVAEGRVVGGHPTADWVNELPSKHTRVIIRFKDASSLVFNDMRVFGWIKIITNDQFSIFNKKLPPDVVDPEYSVEYLIKVMKGSSRAVKLVLLDQAKIGGLGNIYVNDALWEAGTKPTRKANSLTRKEVEKIHTATIKVIMRGIETGGASESTYKHINGMGGSYQNEVLTYRRENELCKREGCKGVIKKIKLGGRGTFYCPLCQK